MITVESFRHALPSTSLHQMPMSPNLARALNNPAVRRASYSLPDGTIMIDPNQASSPSLTAALQNPYLKSAAYTLPDGTIIIDPRKPLSPNLSGALQNSALKSASYKLPDGTVITDPNAPISPNLARVSETSSFPGSWYLTSPRLQDHSHCSPLFFRIADVLLPFLLLVIPPYAL